MIARLRADLARIWPAADGDVRLGLAVSGGPDSLALLLLAHGAMGGRIAAATVDHGLRAESAGEAAMVAEICDRLGVPHAILPVSVSAGNLQSAARAARYAALAEWCRSENLAALATAHHADDQAETFLMRANRASGLAGLAGVRASGLVPESDILLLRPLLGWRRAELAAIVQAAGLSAVQDPTNADMHYDRARIRAAIAQADWLDPAAIARSAAHLADAQEALSSLVEATWRDRATVGEGAIALSPPAGRYLRLACVARAIETLGRPARGEAVAQLATTLELGEGGNLGGVHARVERGKWVFRPEPPRRS